MLPDLDGFEVCRRLRADGRPHPGAVPHRQDATEDKVRGLTLGGDDYLVKPFSLEELVARINAVLRRAGDGAADGRGAALRRPGDGRRRPPGAPAPARRCRCRPTEYNLLRYLLLNQGRVLSKAQILDHVWEYDFGGDGGVVETYIGYLRRKLDTRRAPADPDDPRRRATRCGSRADRAPVSLRTRLLVAMGLVATLLVLAAVVVTRTTTAHLVDQVDTQLVRFAGPDQPGPGSMPVPPPGQASTGDPPVDPQVGGNTSSDGTSSDDAVFTTVYVGTFIDGVLVTRMAPNLTGETAPVPRFSAAQAYEAVRTGDPVTVASSDGSTRYRVVARLDDRSGDLVVLGLQLDSVDDAIARLLVVEAATTAVVLLVLGLISWWVLRLGVRPIKRMTAAATTIAAGDLTSRIPGATEGTEAAALGSALNAMLERIEASFGEQTRSEQRLRRFVADASHELRTPVTTIRGYAELYRVGALENRQELDTAMRRTEAEAVRMGNLVAEMLQLARLDQGRPTRREPVRLDQVAAEAVADLRAVHPDRPVHADLAPVTVMGDHDQLHQVLANLLTNAVVHTGPGTRGGGRRRGGRSRGPTDGHRSRARHGPGDRGPGLRALLPGRPVPEPVLRRDRPGPGHRGRDRRVPPRHRGHRQPAPFRYGGSGGPRHRADRAPGPPRRRRGRGTRGPDDGPTVRLIRSSAGWTAA